MKIAVLLGGTSDERDVSLSSGAQVAAALRSAGHEVLAVDTAHGLLGAEEEQRLLAEGVRAAPPAQADLARLDESHTMALTRQPDLAEVDLYFVALHGGTGEDGTIQALLDAAGVAYTGSDRLGCSLAMDKEVTKRLLRDAGIPTPDWIADPRDADQIEAALGLPVFLKVAGGGSSLRLVLAHDRAELEAAVRESRGWGDLVLAERYVRGRELTVGILGDEALPVGEIIPANEYFDYECKYQPGKAEEIFPADLPADVAERLQALALRAHHALRLRDYSRIDFMLDEGGDRLVPGGERRAGHDAQQPASQGRPSGWYELCGAVRQDRGTRPNAPDRPFCVALPPCGRVRARPGTRSPREGLDRAGPAPGPAARGHTTNDMPYASRSFGFGFGGALTPVVKRLLIANVVVFFATLIVGLDLMIEWFGFHPTRIVFRPWGAVTYMFVHGDLMHLAVNMLVLFFFGPPLESRWGEREFVRFYLICGLGGVALSYLFLPSSVIGASAAMYGLMLAFAMNWPDVPIYVWGIFPVKAKYLVGFLFVLTLLSARAVIQDGAGGNIAHLAHLGGLLAGLVYLKADWRPGHHLRNVKKAATRRRRLAIVPGKEDDEPSGTPDPARPHREDSALYDRVDAVLDKISAEGMSSLTSDELALLDQVSKRHRTN